LRVPHSRPTAAVWPRAPVTSSGPAVGICEAVAAVNTIPSQNPPPAPRRCASRNGGQPRGGAAMSAMETLHWRAPGSVVAPQGWSPASQRLGRGPRGRRGDDVADRHIYARPSAYMMEIATQLRVSYRRLAVCIDDGIADADLRCSRIGSSHESASFVGAGPGRVKLGGARMRSGAAHESCVTIRPGIGDGRRVSLLRTPKLGDVHRSRKLPGFQGRTVLA
jgi:hypothetical protein